MRNINIKGRKINTFKLLASSILAALGPSFGLIAHYLTNYHALVGVAIGVFSSAFLIQLLGLNKNSNDGTASVAGSEGSSSGGSSIDIGNSSSGGSS